MHGRLARSFVATKTIKECHRADQTELHHTAVGGDRCRGSDRLGTDCLGGSRSAEKSCTGRGGSGSVCQSRGNVEINIAPPPVRYYPYGAFPYLLGGLHGGLR